MSKPAANLIHDSYSPGKDWVLQWADEFDAEVLDTANWNLQLLEAGHFNEEWQCYTDSPDNVYIEDSCLVISANHDGDEHGMGQYSSARLNTAQKQTFCYGKIAARIQLPQGNGIWPAFWMLGANCDENGGDTPWPICGEIDILELYGSRDPGVVEANIHYADSSGDRVMLDPPAYKLQQGKFADNFHVFEIEWDEHQIIWRVDGNEYASAALDAEERAVYHNEFFMLLNIAIGGNWGGIADDSTGFPQCMYIDWVRVYRKV